MVEVLGVPVDVADYRPFIKTIGDNPYLTVEGRLMLLRDVLAKLGHKPTDYSVDSTSLIDSRGLVLCVARVRTPWGEYTGTSATDPNATDRKKAIEAGNPYEVAETSAVGRALGFAGLDLAGKIESAAGMAKAGYNTAGGGSAGSGFSRVGFGS